MAEPITASQYRQMLSAADSAGVSADEINAELERRGIAKPDTMGMGEKAVQTVVGGGRLALSSIPKPLLYTAVGGGTAGAGTAGALMVRDMLRRRRAGSAAPAPQAELPPETQARITPPAEPARPASRTPMRVLTEADVEIPGLSKFDVGEEVSQTFYQSEKARAGREGAKSKPFRPKKGGKHKPLSASEQRIEMSRSRPIEVEGQPARAFETPSGPQRGVSGPALANRAAELEAVRAQRGMGAPMPEIDPREFANSGIPGLEAEATLQMEGMTAAERNAIRRELQQSVMRRALGGAAIGLGIGGPLFDIATDPQAIADEGEPDLNIPYAGRPDQLIRNAQGIRTERLGQLLQDPATLEEFLTLLQQRPAGRGATRTRRY